MKYLAFVLVATIMAFSAPAYNGEVDLKQNDGSKFKAKIKGDEWFNWVEDKSGNIIKYSKSNKRYEYAEVVEINGELDLVPSGVAVVTSSSESTSADTNTSANTTIPKVDKELLYKIWKTKRKKALNN